MIYSLYQMVKFNIEHPEKEKDDPIYSFRTFWFLASISYTLCSFVPLLNFYLSILLDKIRLQNYMAIIEVLVVFVTILYII